MRQPIKRIAVILAASNLSSASDTTTMLELVKGASTYRSKVEIAKHQNLRKEGLELTVPVIDTNRTPWKTKIELDGKIELLADDPTMNENSTPLSKRFFFGLIRRLPFGKSSTYFESKEEAESFRVHLLEALHCDHIPPEGEWVGDETDDDSTARFLLSNNGSNWIYKTDEGYECRMQWLDRYEMRQNFEKYGTTSFFDIEGKLTAISRGTETFRPGDDEWEWAKLAARTTAFIGASGVHLVELHWIWSNVPNVGMHLYLDSDHPLFRLLHPHFYASAGTALDSLLSLLPERGLVHRSTGFRYPDYKKLIVDMLDSFSFQPFPDSLKDRGFLDHDLNEQAYPLQEDGLNLYRCIESYVYQYVDLHYQSDEAVMNDSDLRAMWAHMEKYMAGLPQLDLSGVKVVLTEIIFKVTGWHQHIGNVNQGGSSPLMVSDHLSRHHNFATVESATILACITALTAGMVSGVGHRQYPTLLSNWDFIFQSDAERKIYSSFKGNLYRLAEANDVRNEKRKYALNDFNPRYTRCSISS